MATPQKIDKQEGFPDIPFVGTIRDRNQKERENLVLRRRVGANGTVGRVIVDPVNNELVGLPSNQDLVASGEAYKRKVSEEKSKTSTDATKPDAKSVTTISNYTERVTSKSTSRAALAVSSQTLAKIQILEKNNPPLGKIARELFGGGGTTPQQFIENLQGFDKTTRDRLLSLFSQEIYLNSQAAVVQGGTGLTDEITGNEFNIGGALLSPFASTDGNRFQGIVDSIDRSVGNSVSRINETFKPVSTEIGQTLGNISRFANNPLGTVALIPGSIKNVIERNNKDFAARLEASYKKYNMDDLAHVPSLIAGSVRNLIGDIDALVTLPVIIISDLYNGLIDIINDLADAVQEIVANLVKQVFTNFLDGLLLEALEVLQEVSDLAGQIFGISTVFSGATQFTQVLFNVQTYITQLGQFINNPLDLLFAYAPPQVSEALYLLRNPQQLVNDILPLELSEYFAKISQITGFGFNGNMGYGFVSVLDGLRGGVVSSILSNFANQYPILNSLLSVLNTNVPPLNAEQPSIVTPSPVSPNNENIKTNKQGTPVLVTVPPASVPTIQDQNIQLELPADTTPAQTGIPQPVTTITTPAAESGRGRFNARNSPATIADQRRSAEYDAAFAAGVATGFARESTTGGSGSTRRRVD
jgi:hypothetical protein